MHRISFVIANYNYERFVARSIESALGVDWPHREVIVVDDGSLDGSRAVIESFGDLITTIFQKNAGQRVANNTGFAASSGDIIVFLDADDVVEPDFAREVAAAWSPGLSKVQVQMSRVDVRERPLSSFVPRIAAAPAPEQIRRWEMATGEYPTPPGSGNAYARSFLERFFPIGPEHDSFTDSTCLVMAPLLGDIVTVLKPLVRYRQHGANDSRLDSLEANFGREISRSLKRQQSSKTICAELGLATPVKRDLRRGRFLLQLRVASLRLTPKSHPFPGDRHMHILVDALRCPFGTGFEPASRRLLISIWTIATLVAPLQMARWLVGKRFGSVG